MRFRATTVLALVGVLATAGCLRVDTGDEGPQADSQPDTPASPPPPTEPTDAPPAGPDGAESPTGRPTEVEVSVTDVATELQVPWDVVDHDGRTLLTERDSGRLLEIADDGTTTEVRTFAVDPAGEGGLLGLASDGSSLFVYYTASDDNRVVRLDDVDGGEEQPVVTGIPKGPTHDGGRMRIGPDGYLYIGTGDSGHGGLAQDEGSLGGKILRVDRDGEAPDDNPFDGSPVWSLGHRNVQGLAFDAEERLWAAELGPDVDDEINLIEAGQNYGWPEVTGAPGVEGYVDAAHVAQPAEASWSGATVPNGSAIPQWDGDLLATGLRGEQLWRLDLDAHRVAAAETHYAGEFGRLRTARLAPDGALWLLTSNTDGRGSPAENDDRLLRVGP